MGACCTTKSKPSHQLSQADKIGSMTIFQTQSVIERKEGTGPKGESGVDLDADYNERGIKVVKEIKQFSNAT